VYRERGKKKKVGRLTYIRKRGSCQKKDRKKTNKQRGQGRNFIYVPRKKTGGKKKRESAQGMRGGKKDVGNFRGGSEEETLLTIRAREKKEEG